MADGMPHVGSKGGRLSGLQVAKRTSAIAQAKVPKTRTDPGRKRGCSADPVGVPAVSAGQRRPRGPRRRARSASSWGTLGVRSAVQLGKRGDGPGKLGEVNGIQKPRSTTWSVRSHRVGTGKTGSLKLFIKSSVPPPAVAGDNGRSEAQSTEAAADLPVQSVDGCGDAVEDPRLQVGGGMSVGRRRRSPGLNGARQLTESLSSGRNPEGKDSGTGKRKRRSGKPGINEKAPAFVSVPRQTGRGVLGSHHSKDERVAQITAIGDVLADQDDEILVWQNTFPDVSVGGIHDAVGAKQKCDDERFTVSENQLVSARNFLTPGWTMKPCTHAPTRVPANRGLNGNHQLNPGTDKTQAADARPRPAKTCRGPRCSSHLAAKLHMPSHEVLFLCHWLCDLQGLVKGDKRQAGTTNAALSGILQQHPQLSVAAEWIRNSKGEFSQPPGKGTLYTLGNLNQRTVMETKRSTGTVPHREGQHPGAHFNKTVVDNGSSQASHFPGDTIFGKWMLSALAKMEGQSLEAQQAVWQEARMELVRKVLENLAQESQNCVPQSSLRDIEDNMRLTSSISYLLESESQQCGVSDALPPLPPAVIRPPGLVKLQTDRVASMAGKMRREAVGAVSFPLRDDSVVKHYLLNRGTRSALLASVPGMQKKNIDGLSALESLINDRHFYCLHFKLAPGDELKPCKVPEEGDSSPGAGIEDSNVQLTITIKKGIGGTCPLRSAAKSLDSDGLLSTLLLMPPLKAGNPSADEGNPGATADAPSLAQDGTHLARALDFDADATAGEAETPCNCLGSREEPPYSMLKPWTRTARGAVLEQALVPQPVCTVVSMEEWFHSVEATAASALGACNVEYEAEPSVHPEQMKCEPSGPGGEGGLVQITGAQHGNAVGSSGEPGPRFMANCGSGVGRNKKRLAETSGCDIGGDLVNTLEKNTSEVSQCLYKMQENNRCNLRQWEGFKGTKVGEAPAQPDFMPGLTAEGGVQMRESIQRPTLPSAGGTPISQGPLQIDSQKDGSCQEQEHIETETGSESGFGDDVVDPLADPDYQPLALLQGVDVFEEEGIDEFLEEMTRIEEVSRWKKRDKGSSKRSAVGCNPQQVGLPGVVPKLRMYTLCCRLELFVEESLWTMLSREQQNELFSVVRESEVWLTYQMREWNQKRLNSYCEQLRACTRDIKIQEMCAFLKKGNSAAETPADDKMQTEVGNTLTKAESKLSSEVQELPGTQELEKPCLSGIECHAAKACGSLSTAQDIRECCNDALPPQQQEGVECPDVVRKVIAANDNQEVAGTCNDAERDAAGFLSHQPQMLASRMDLESRIVKAAAAASTANEVQAVRCAAGTSMPWPYYFIATRDCFTHRLIPVKKKVIRSGREFIRTDYYFSPGELPKNYQEVVKASSGLQMNKEDGSEAGKAGAGADMKMSAAKQEINNQDDTRTGNGTALCPNSDLDGDTQNSLLSKFSSENLLKLSEKTMAHEVENGFMAPPSAGGDARSLNTATDAECQLAACSRDEVIPGKCRPLETCLPWQCGSNSYANYRTSQGMQQNSPVASALPEGPNSHMESVCPNEQSCKTADVVDGSNCDRLMLNRSDEPGKAPEGAFPVGVTTYTGVFSEKELLEIEEKAEEVNKKVPELPKECFHHTYGRSGNLKRTKFFFGARYLWTREQLSEADSKIAKGVRVDVVQSPSWTKDLVEKPLVSSKIIPEGFINSWALNHYHDGSEGIQSHFDDSGRFCQPIYSLRLYSDSRLSFGTQLYGYTNGAFYIPMPRGCITIMENGSYAANGVKHCVRPMDMMGKNAGLIMRKINPQAMEAAWDYHLRETTLWLKSLSLKPEAVPFKQRPKALSGSKSGNEQQQTRFISDIAVHNVCHRVLDRCIRRIEQTEHRTEMEADYAVASVLRDMTRKIQDQWLEDSRCRRKSRAIVKQVLDDVVRQVEHMHRQDQQVARSSYSDLNQIQRVVDSMVRAVERSQCSHKRGRPRKGDDGTRKRARFQDAYGSCKVQGIDSQWQRVVSAAEQAITAALALQPKSLATARMLLREYGNSWLTSFVKQRMAGIAKGVSTDPPATVVPTSNQLPEATSCQGSLQERGQQIVGSEQLPDRSPMSASHPAIDTGQKSDAPQYKAGTMSHGGSLAPAVASPATPTRTATVTTSGNACMAVSCPESFHTSSVTAFGSAPAPGEPGAVNSTVMLEQNSGDASLPGKGDSAEQVTGSKMPPLEVQEKPVGTEQHTGSSLHAMNQDALVLGTSMESGLPNWHGCVQNLHSQASLGEDRSLQGGRTKLQGASELESGGTMAWPNAGHAGATVSSAAAGASVHSGSICCGQPSAYVGSVHGQTASASCVTSPLCTSTQRAHPSSPKTAGPPTLSNTPVDNRAPLSLLEVSLCQDLVRTIMSTLTSLMTTSRAVGGSTEASSSLSTPHTCVERQTAMPSEGQLSRESGTEPGLAGDSRHRLYSSLASEGVRPMGDLSACIATPPLKRAKKGGSRKYTLTPLAVCFDCEESGIDPSTPCAGTRDAPLCEGNILWQCAGGCRRTFHHKCREHNCASMPGNGRCSDCALGRHTCMVCKDTSDSKGRIVKCGMGICGRFYHTSCVMSAPHTHVLQGVWTPADKADGDLSSLRFRCPSHYCHGCGLSGANVFSVMCIRCPAAYHSRCRPEGCIVLSKKMILCPKHNPKSGVVGKGGD